jgi:alginate O-acetyltransferase complex protein AlgI
LTLKGNLVLKERRDYNVFPILCEAGWSVAGRRRDWAAMVFSDPMFLLGFLPAALLIFHTLRGVGGTAAVTGLVVLSMLFYAYWSIPFLLLLLGQIAGNYALALRLERTQDRRTLGFAITANLCILGYFKYRNFLLETAADIAGIRLHLESLIVPLGISFHTFQQIALLVDVKNRSTKVPPLLNYTFFVLFFPQLIAGPIVLHREMGQQVAAVRAGAGRGLKLFGAGVLVFAFGLFKKVCLADNIAHYADFAFTPGRTLMMPEAWIGTTAYTLQLFFDFSGYSDMAVGLALMFGFKLPNNFLVPYAASSPIEFWRRWHITMMRFFTMYLYTPLWLRMRRVVRRTPWFGDPPNKAVEVALTIALPVLLTFFLSGLWHGAGWTFICFGVTHGIAVIITQAWTTAGLRSPPRWLGWFLTMIVVLIGAVYFRSNDLAQAHYILQQMFMPSNGLSIPDWLASWLPMKLPIGTFTLFSELRDTAYCLTWTALLALLSVLLPPLAADPEAIVPTRAKAVAVAGMAWLIVGMIGEPRTFLYFAF